ncbi:hypothetical protein LINPERPRIM_LOCUS25552 [Linum perenne]
MGGRTVGAYFIFIHYSLHIHTPSRCLQEGATIWNCSVL